MTLRWTGGIVETTDADGRPVVDEWRPVSVPGRSTAFADAADRSIAYRTTVRDPRESESERALLELRGAYDRARVWINGIELGTHEPHFVPARFEFDPRPENELVVVCDPPSSLAGIYGTDEVPSETATPGVWWGIDVESRPRTFLRRLDATPRLTDGTGVIDVAAEVDAGVSIDDAVTLSLRPAGFRGGASMERVRVRADAGERVAVSKSIEVRDPELWWPRGYGPQHRYAIRAKLGDEVREETVGFCRVERDADGLVVNGQRVRARGFTRLPGGDPTADVERAVAANAAILRARAHVPSKEFYAACDEAGVLVWQDLPAIGADIEVERGETLATAIARAYGHHPSLAMYGVYDQPIDPFADPLGGGPLSKLALRYRAWRTAVDDGPARKVAATFPDDRPVVAVTGAPGTGADAAHLAPGWQYLTAADVDWLLDTYPSLGAIVGRFGAASLTDDDVDPATVPALDSALLERRAETAAGSRRYQARTLKTIAEALRRRRCGVLTAATLRDPGPGGGPGVLTIDGEPKPAYGALAASFEPIQAVLDAPPEPGTVGITLCNDTASAREATVGWRAGDDGDETTVAVDPLETAPAGTARIPADADRVDLSVSLADRTVRNRYDL